MWSHIFKVRMLPFVSEKGSDLRPRNEKAGPFSTKQHPTIKL